MLGKEAPELNVNCTSKMLFIQASGLASNLFIQLNTIVAQIDSRSNLEIAAAAKHDSASMLTIAFLTALFLPPTYVCVSAYRTL